MTPANVPRSGSAWYPCAVTLLLALPGCVAPLLPAPPLLGPSSPLPNRLSDRDALRTGLNWIVVQAGGKPTEEEREGESP